MVVCKYFQQGTCRFGQYCRFEHNNYGGNNQSERSKPYGEGKSVVLGVAEEVLASERGGQWLLSCFGPFKEQSCIPGMKDVSPEEVRWEMYQAQKNGTVDQTKLQFQQLCQAMSAKRAALKNPTHETASMLEKMQKCNKGNAFSAKTNFALSTSQLVSSNTGTNVFGAKTFATTSGPFSGGFPASATATTTSVFERPNTNSTTVFGAKAAFGGNAVFGNQPATNSIFGGATSTTTSVFGGAQQNVPTFGSSAQTSASFLSMTQNPQSIFGQSATFGVTTQPNNIYPTTQSTTSVFSGAAAAKTPLFASSLTTRANTSPFGGTIQGTTAPFGGAKIQPSGSIFGNSVAAPVSSPIGSASIFGQSQTTAAFGGAPIFGSATNFGAAAPPSNYAKPPAFGNPTNVFEAATTTSTFGSNVQATNSFNALAIPSQNVFTNSQNSNATFGNISSNIVSESSATTFGSVPLPPTSATTTAYANTPFGTTAATPFPRTSTFGSSIMGNNATSTFGAAVLSPPSVGSTMTTVGFASVPPSTPFAFTTTTTTTSNPFAPRSQQSTMSFASTPSGTTFGGMSVGPFGNSACALTDATEIENSVYSVDIDLTDDERNIYKSDQFTLGKIPLKPPSILLR